MRTDTSIHLDQHNDVTFEVEHREREGRRDYFVLYIGDAPNLGDRVNVFMSPEQRIELAQVLLATDENKSGQTTKS